MVRDNLKLFLNSIPKEVTLVAVSKTKPVELIQQAYDAGQRVFGENKAQDLAAKYPLLPNDINWHFIGHLQRNKIKYIAPFVHCIHGIDSLRLLKEVNKLATKHNRIIKCLLQFYIAKEETKFGLSYEEATAILEDSSFPELTHIHISGVMGMASYTDDETQVLNEFKQLSDYFHRLKSKYFCDDEQFKEISMGMSGDYKLAISAGSTMIRIGTSIFGSRNY